jgi:hypothetical protein
LSWQIFEVINQQQVENEIHNPYPVKNILMDVSVLSPWNNEINRKWIDPYPVKNILGVSALSQLNRSCFSKPWAWLTATMDRDSKLLMPVLCFECGVLSV